MDLWGIAATSMSNDMARLASVANNVANSSTTGFKQGIALARPFAEFLPGDPAAEVGAPYMQSATDHRAGALRYTGNPLDLALENANQFFEVSGPGGTAYTRQGNFHVDARGRLVNDAGMALMGTSGEIVVTGGAPAIDASGRVVDGDRATMQLRIMTVGDLGALEKMGDGLFDPRSAAATQTAGTNVVRQGYLESSNVNVMSEMVRLIETMRRFELNQRMLQGYDAMLDKAIRTLSEF